MSRPSNHHPHHADRDAEASFAVATGSTGSVQRRSVIRAGAVVVGMGAFGTTLAGCGSDADPATGAAPAPTDATSSASGSASPTAEASASVQPTRTPSSTSAKAKAKASTTTSRTTSEDDDETSSTRTTSKTATTSKTTSKPTTTTKKPTTTTTTKTAAPDPTDISLAQIPVGGAVVRTIKGRAVVLSRTGSNSVVGFDAHCTHAGCIVQAAGGRLDCPCHGSAFDLRSGAVLQGPAASALPRISVRVHDGGVSVG